MDGRSHERRRQTRTINLRVIESCFAAPVAWVPRFCCPSAASANITFHLVVKINLLLPTLFRIQGIRNNTNRMSLFAPVYNWYFKRVTGRLARMGLTYHDAIAETGVYDKAVSRLPPSMQVSGRERLHTHAA